MRAWKTWQNWVAVLAGAYAAASPLWTPVDAVSAATLIIAGALILIAAVFALGTPVVLIMNWMQTLFGAGLFIAPWVLLFADMIPAALTAWTCGIVTAVVGALASLKVQRLHKKEAEHDQPNYDVL